MAGALASRRAAALGALHVLWSHRSASHISTDVCDAHALLEDDWTQTTRLPLLDPFAEFFEIGFAGIKLRGSSFIHTRG